MALLLSEIFFHRTCEAGTDSSSVLENECSICGIIGTVFVDIGILLLLCIEAACMSGADRSRCGKNSCRIHGIRRPVVIHIAKHAGFCFRCGSGGFSRLRCGRSGRSGGRGACGRCCGSRCGGCGSRRGCCSGGCRCCCGGRCADNAVTGDGDGIAHFSIFGDCNDPGRTGTHCTDRQVDVVSIRSIGISVKCDNIGIFDIGIFQLAVLGGNSAPCHIPDLHRGGHIHKACLT